MAGLCPVSSHAWTQWGGARPPSGTLHLDTAAVGRSSLATLAAVADHARLEAEVGGYVAEARAEPELTALRRDVATVLGTDDGGVAFIEGAAAALDALLTAWPLPPGARIGVPAAEWGPNLELLTHRGFRVELLPVDEVGVLVLDALEAELGSGPPDILLVDQVAAHRGLVQPVADVLAIAHEHGVPVWVDAAQTVGHLEVAPGADAVVATSRKWLGGPRGVGMLAVAEQHRDTLRVRRPQKHPEWSQMQCLESEEAHVAGRIGLGVAVREYLEAGSEAVAARLVEVGRWTRELVDGLPGWEIVAPEAPAGATTALMATAGQDVAQVRERLLAEDRILTSTCLPWRAPADLVFPPDDAPVLRVSPHVDLTVTDLERLGEALLRS